MKGYFVNDGFMGLINGSYMLFSNESEYYEILEEEDVFDQDQGLL